MSKAEIVIISKYPSALFESSINDLLNKKNILYPFVLSFSFALSCFFKLIMIADLTRNPLVDLVLVAINITREASSRSIF